MVHLIKFVSRSENETFKLGLIVAGSLVPGDVVALKGTLGSGKSILARGIIRGLGVSGPIPSPSFIIIANYRGKVPVNHVDLYRLKHREELEGLGIEDTILSEGISIVEWAEKIEELLPANTVHIDIQTCQEPDQRLITLESSEPGVRSRLVSVAIDLLREQSGVSSQY